MKEAQNLDIGSDLTYKDYRKMETKNRQRGSSGNGKIHHY